MRGFEGVQSLIADYRWAIDIEICVFPQDGLTNYPGTDELLVEALKRGAKVVGGAPRYDTDHAGQIRRIFELAREFDVDIDIHLDVGNTPEEMDIHLVCELTEQYRRGGRVVVGHMAKLSTMPPGEVAALARRLADTGIAVTVLPLTDLFVMGRDQDHNVRRGVADANFLVEHGVNCSLSTNNVLNPVTPYGDCSLIRMANLHANVLQIGQPAQLRECFRDADRALGAAAQSARITGSRSATRPTSSSSMPSRRSRPWRRSASRSRSSSAAGRPWFGTRQSSCGRRECRPKSAVQLRGDQRAAGAGDGPRRSARAERLADRIGAVDQQLKLLGEKIGVAGAGRGGKGPQPLADGALMGKDHARERGGRAREIRCRC